MVFGSLGGRANQVMIHIRGDDKDYKNALKGSDQATSSFASKIKGYAPMIGAAFAGAAVGFVAMSVKMAAAEEAVSRQTEALLKSQGIMWTNVSGELDAYMKQLEKLTAYNDTDLQMAFNAMIAAGMSYTDAMESMNTVTSMAYSLNRDLGSMALLVGKAYNGQTGELSRYGIVLDESLEKTEKFAGLQKHVADNFADASERADSFEGQMQTLNNEMSNFAEAVGNELIPAATEMTKGLNSLGVTGRDVGTTLGRLIALPWTIPSGLSDHVKLMKEVSQLNKEGYDTEKELVDLLSLHSSKLAEMTEDEFELATMKLTMAGYYDKTLMLQDARAYAIKQEIQAARDLVKLKKDILDIELAITSEIYEQSDAMKRAENTGGWQRLSTSDSSSLGVAGETRQSGALTIRPATNSELSAVRSGV